MPSLQQTRWSISLKGLTFQRMKNHCDQNGISMAGQLEEWIDEALSAQDVPVPTETRIKRKFVPATPTWFASGIWEF